jgi:hypothetical protein
MLLTIKELASKLNVREGRAYLAAPVAYREFKGKA